MNAAPQTFIKTRHTGRLTLSPLDTSDAPFILVLLNDPDWLKHIGNRDVNNLEDARGYIQLGPQNMYKQGLGLLKVSAGGQAIGLCGLLQRTYLSCPDIGYAFLPEGRGHGYAREAARAVKDAFVVRYPDCPLAGLVSPDNHRSIGVLTSLGMSFRQAFVAPHETRQTALYTLGAQQALFTAEAVPLP